ncbi:MAG: FAD-binding oxidoreductase [Betaproteobacteria bacterium]|nr:FAD-binding oxidoreductase [Betaproteobacteria bacterium]MDH3438743.1 FAD-binding oxidoreductase [Betaproteobacteria bacterium]
MSTLTSKTIEQFRSAIRGQVIVPGDAEYEQARKIWNSTIDRKPAIIARCLGNADVVAAISLAREQELPLAVRGGGHNIAGNAVCDDGLVVDLSLMRSVRVDPDARLARVEPGALLGDVDQECQAYGLATPLGINSTTGIAGLTLGGGFGWLSRKHGMTVDNLVSVEVITADGQRVVASDKKNPELFWAVRGGGGNFGVVTMFEFQLHRVGPEILSGLIVFPMEQAKSVLEQYREFIKTMPEDLNVWVVLRNAPPLPFLPESVHGKGVIVLAIVYLGDADVGRRAVEPLRGFGKAYGEHIGPAPYAAWQQAFDPLLGPGARNYWKSHNLAVIKDETIDAALRCAGTLPTGECEIFIGLLGGAASRVPVDAMAYGARDAEMVMNIHARWQTMSDDKRCIGWAREAFEAVGRHATGSVYVNFLTAEEGARVGAAYGANHARLVEIKNRYDPTNRFRLNQNIRPSI